TLSPRQRPPVPPQARLTGNAGPRRSVRPPRHVAVHEAHDLPAPRIKAKEPGSARPARSLEETEQLMDEPGRFPTWRCTVSPIRTAPLIAPPGSEYSLIARSIP